MKNIVSSYILYMALFLFVSWMTSCGGNNPLYLDQSDQISECGGFEAAGQPIMDVIPDYCSAEVLHWVYDEEATTLKLANTRVYLNCCGEHSMEIVLDNGVYVVTETDRPVDGDGRCGCGCVFDFTVTASGIPLETVQIKIRRIETDQQPRSRIVYEGELDLGAGSGFVVIDESVVNCDTI